MDAVMRFNPRAPRAGRATVVDGVSPLVERVSIRARPVRGARPQADHVERALPRVSIRARPVRGARPRGLAPAARAQRVSIRARPVRGARPFAACVPVAHSRGFQSARAPCGARDVMPAVSTHSPRSFQSARAPCGARDCCSARSCTSTSCVSIRARPVRGARLRWYAVGNKPPEFQSARAPCGARDRLTAAGLLPIIRFNPRAPRAGRATPLTQLLVDADDSAYFARTRKHITKFLALPFGPPLALPGGNSRSARANSCARGQRFGFARVRRLAAHRSPGRENGRARAPRSPCHR